jgi:two-component system CitB family sensor kinase
MTRHTTLSGQLLALQLLIVLAVLAGVTAVSIAQSGETTKRSESRTARSAAENVAANPVVRTRVPTAQPRGDAALATVGESLRSLSGAGSVLLARPDGTILTSADPAQVGQQATFGSPGVVAGQSWTGLLELADRTVVSAQVPIYDTGDVGTGTPGRIVGVAIVERLYPSVLERWRDAVPNLLTYLGIAGGLGVIGSLLLSRRVKRQTLGLEPQEITSLVEHREAMLHGLKEGLIGLDLEGRITLVNDSAARLLNIPHDSAGQVLTDLPLEPQLGDVLTGRRNGTDLVVVSADRVLTLNRREITSRGKVIGWVTTLRDRTELDVLRRELGVTRATTDTLRAQTHEFANRLHVISGLVQLRQHDEVVRFIDNVTRGRAELNEDVTARVLDPALAALLVAKSSLAAEWGVALRFAETAALGRIDDDLSADLTTVVGNLVDNALEAATAGGSDRSRGAWAELDLRDDGHEVVVTVRDSGPGVDDGIADRVFERGFSTKGLDQSAQRGFGLALSGLVCRRRGGSIAVRNDGGAVFTARLPRAVVLA